MKDKHYYIIGTAGHVDHGKTALVRALTGMETDRLDEEKKRGLSIELGFAYMSSDPCEGSAQSATARGGFLRDNTIAFIDVPGHERFIRSMLAGVGSIDLALFCVAADDGVMPQTREHLDILHLLGLRRAIIVITKVDLATPERVAEVRAAVEELLSGTTLEGSPIVEVSVKEGPGQERRNIDELKARIFSELASVAAVAGTGAVRLPVDRVFSVKGYGAVVTGTVVSGTLRVGDELALFTGKGLARVGLRVRGLESHNQKVEAACRGQRAAVNLTGVTHHDIHRGATLVPVSLAGEQAAVTKLDCAVDLPPSAKIILKDRCRLKLYHFASERNVVFQLAGGGSAGRLYGRLHIDRPLYVQRGDRFILRDPSVRATVGGGVVLMPYPSPEVTARLKELDLGALSNGMLTPTVVAMVRKSGYGLTPRLLGAILNMDAGAFAAFTDAAAELLVFKDTVLVREDVALVEKAILEVVKDHHWQRPGEGGMRVENIRAAAKAALGRAKGLMILDGLLEAGFLGDMAGRSLLCSAASGYSLPSHRPELSGTDKELDRVLRALFEGKIKSVASAEIGELSFAKEDIQRMLAALVEQGEVVKLRNGVYIGALPLKTARDRLEAHIKLRGSIKVADMRDLLGTGRKLAIEILEYFDKERITLRKGDERVLR